jgi:hypothetical protein
MPFGQHTADADGVDVVDVVVVGVAVVVELDVDMPTAVTPEATARAHRQESLKFMLSESRRSIALEMSVVSGKTGQSLCSHETKDCLHSAWPCTDPERRLTSSLRQKRSGRGRHDSNFAVVRLATEPRRHPARKPVFHAYGGLCSVDRDAI